MSAKKQGPRSIWNGTLAFGPRGKTPVAVTNHLASAFTALPAKELRDLVLQRLLQDQPRSQATDRLDRVVLLADTGQHLIQF